MFLCVTLYQRSYNFIKPKILESGQKNIEAFFLRGNSNKTFSQPNCNIQKK